MKVQLLLRKNKKLGSEGRKKKHDQMIMHKQIKILDIKKEKREGNRISKNKMQRMTQPSQGP